ncbi:MAG: hypothetical protein HeimC3_48010 [Candidatus Heimdallarchaeota archaeon LC_3]|nr:MAG: hypothetical protein HeimC3_48010 [Candidatus Heimdallarchaeota archaeon LC_3]
MSVVKIKNKSQLDQLQAKVTLRLGRKPTQQELLDLCIDYSSQNIDDFIRLLDQAPILNEEKINRILKKRDQRKEIPYIYTNIGLNKDDKDIYG